MSYTVNDFELDKDLDDELNDPADLDEEFIPLMSGDKAVLGIGNNSSTGNFRQPKNQKGINHKHYQVLALHLSGKTAKEISLITNYSLISIYNILKREDIIAMRQQILSGIGDEFEVLFHDVVETIRGLLKSTKETVQLEACEKWLKAHNKYGKEKNTINVTAEDVVFQILNNK